MSDVPGTSAQRRELPPPVVPRAHRPGGEASLPVHVLVAAAVRDPVAGRGLVLITAGPGGGKTTALRHLRATLPAEPPVALFDANEAAEAQQAARSGIVVLAMPTGSSAPVAVAVFALSRWGFDDCLEYLAAVHRDRCASVLARWRDDPSRDLLDGSPELTVLVLDAMAADAEGVATAREALRRHAGCVVPPGPALDRLILDGPVHAPLDRDQWRWWRHDGFRRVCTAEWIAGRMEAGEMPGQLQSLPDLPETVPEIAAALRLRPAAFAFLRQFFDAGPESPGAPMAATLLLSADPEWRPPGGRPVNLRDARLAGARWAGVDLAGSTLAGACLAGADLSGASLSGVIGDAVDLTGANLRRGRLDAAKLVGATLGGADLSGASARAADFADAGLAGADLCNADCSGAAFVGTDLSAVRAAGADFSAATFTQVDWAGADFTGAIFAGAQLKGADLSGAEWGDARFSRAALAGCNLEGLHLPAADFAGADLAGALLTSTHIPGGQFRGADLTGAGLADVDWEDADLRDVNFDRASFHLGSTRSGLVGSTVPCEGSRTGFYTDDFNDQSYKPPEEIRKACLCGANLVGARVDRADFYLVDLRRATYTRSQAKHFAKSGAILASRGPG